MYFNGFIQTSRLRLKQDRITWNHPLVMSDNSNQIQNNDKASKFSISEIFRRTIFGDSP